MYTLMYFKIPIDRSRITQDIFKDSSKNKKLFPHDGLLNESKT